VLQALGKADDSASGEVGSVDPCEETCPRGRRSSSPGPSPSVTTAMNTMRWQ
jgi:hypothetical protein